MNGIEKDRMRLKKIIEDHVFKKSLEEVDFEVPKTINTLNAHSFCMTLKDNSFENALVNSDILLADGISVVLAARVLTGIRIKKIAGDDLHNYLLNYANSFNKKIFYLGSSDEILSRIQLKVKKEFPNVKLQTFSPPFKQEFSDNDNEIMISKINLFSPDILFVGMTAPKQEKWLDQNRNRIETTVAASIGAVFDFYTGNVRRAPQWMLNMGLEWLYRLLKEPKRMWKRYIINNNVFIYHLLKEKIINS